METHCCPRAVQQKSPAFDIAEQGAVELDNHLWIEQRGAHGVEFSRMLPLFLILGGSLE